jgi:hypothetical protein
MLDDLKQKPTAVAKGTLNLSVGVSIYLPISLLAVALPTAEDVSCALAGNSNYTAGTPITERDTCSHSHIRHAKSPPQIFDQTKLIGRKAVTIFLKSSSGCHTLQQSEAVSSKP